MAFTMIEPTANYGTPPTVPATVPKWMGFSFLPMGTQQLHDGGKWGLYYYQAANVSYLVYDVEQSWRIKPVLGKLRISYAKSVMAQKPCCQED